MVGPDGHVTGVDMTPEMLAKARGAAAEMGIENVEFVEGEAEALPFPDESFDVVISNGVIDVIPDKDAVFAGIRRVLVPAGRIQIADVTIQNPVSEEGREKDRPLDRLPALCWRQSTRHSSSATASSESRREIWSRPMRAPHSRTRAARRRTTAREARR